MRLSEKYAVPEELALLYDFVNTLDLRRYVERGVVHAGGDELATPRRMEAWVPSLCSYIGFQFAEIVSEQTAMPR